MKVLLADDDRVLTNLLSSKLRTLGVETVVAHDAMQALMGAMRSPPDAIVLDIQMPGGNGLETLRKLKANAKTANIPVVVLTGTGNAQTPDQAKSLGAEEYLLKPVDPDALYRVLCGIWGQPADQASSS
jgi:two-component system, OmpR family, phosphate regulon response regulator PhoB